MMRDFVAPSMSEVFQIIDAALKHEPEKTKGKEGVYQFNITGEDAGTYQMIIDENGPRAVEGVEKEPDVTLTVEGDNFRKLVDGSLNPTAAFMSGKLKIKGNMGLALKLQTVLNSFNL
jgi:putative sterol carrier protein